LTPFSALTTEFVDMSIRTGTLTRRVQPVADIVQCGLDAYKTLQAVGLAMSREVPAVSS
jgi:hypothetical protein